MYRRTRCLVLVGFLVVVAACGTLIRSKPAGASAEGIPYCLPQGSVRVTLEALTNDKGGFKELRLDTKTDLVPDPSASFVIESTRSPFSSQEHTVRTESGMLTLVSTENTSRALDVVAALASTVVNIVAFGATGGLQAADTENPTRDEVMELYGMILPGLHSLSVLGDTSKEIAIPGSGGRLVLAAKVPIDGTRLAMPEDSYDGIYARTLRPASVEIKLSVMWKKLLSDRVAKLTAETGALAKEEIALKTVLDDYTKKVATATGDEQKALQEQIDKARKKLGDNADRKAKLPELTQAAKTAADKANEADRRELTVREVIVLVPDLTRLAKLPVTDASLGTTKNSLTLVSGVLAEYKSTYPSTALEIVKVPLKISESLLELPAKILQLKIDYSTKQKQLTELQSQIADIKAAVAAKNAPPSDHALLMNDLERQAEVLKLQKQIAELEKQIRDLSER